MKIELYNVHLHDEIPSVGCGHRVVEAKVGRKWVRVRERSQALLAPVVFRRIRKKVWLSLRPERHAQL